MQLTVERVTGARIAEHLPELARLRIAVFREWPYLYDGSEEYEAAYLQTYVDSADGMMVVVRDDGQVVGASSALPLADETEAFRRPFAEQGHDVSRIFYCGESVLLPGYRGLGLGVRFFQERESHARALGRFDLIAFCAVQRPADHPRRPADYVPLDAFWARRGYRRHPELRATYRWKDLDENEESDKQMIFWLKALAAQGAS